MKMDGEYERHVFTTMFDLYALPDDFPGYEAAKAIGEPYARVAALETAFAEAINDSRFIPYIQLHEFEALLFCGIDYLAKRYPGCEKRCEQLKKDLEKTSNPELINNSPETAPSKRIIKAIEGDKNSITTTISRLPAKMLPKVSAWMNFVPGAVTSMNG